MERIGNVELITKYFIDDRNSGNAILEELLAYVKSSNSDEYDSFISSEKRWENLYYLSPLRGNIVSSFMIQRTDSVLEIGSQCGAITSRLCEMAHKVTCVDTSLLACEINAYRNREEQNLQIYAGKLEQVESELGKYDWITLVDVLGNANQYISSNAPHQDLITMALRHLRPNGTLILTTENRFGLRYFAGVKEPYTNQYFKGLEGYSAGVTGRSFTKEEILKLLQQCGCEQVRFLYPYPDHRFPISIYSDEYLPKEGELIMNCFEMEQNRQVLFDESKVYDSLVNTSLYPVFANSYLIEITV